MIWYKREHIIDESLECSLILGQHGITFKILAVDQHTTALAAVPATYQIIKEKVPKLQYVKSQCKIDYIEERRK